MVTIIEKFIEYKQNEKIIVMKKITFTSILIVLAMQNISAEMYAI